MDGMGWGGGELGSKTCMIFKKTKKTGDELGMTLLSIWSSKQKR